MALDEKYSWAIGLLIALALRVLVILGFIFQIL